MRAIHVRPSNVTLPRFRPGVRRAIIQCVEASPTARSAPVTRRDLAYHRWIWLATGLMGVFFAALLAAGVAAGVSQHPLRAGAVAAFACSGGLLLIWLRPPGLDAPTNHLALVLASFLTAALFFAGQPGGGIGIGCAMFVGPLVAVRLQDRRQISAHLAFATSLLVMCALSGAIDQGTQLLLLSSTAGIWVMGICTMLVLEGVEAQGAELALLVRTDPISGARNRRALEEVVDRVVGGRAPTAHELGLVVVRVAERGAADLLARPDAADDTADEHARSIHDALRDAAPDAAMIVRLDDEFVIVVQDRSVGDLGPLAATARARLHSRGLVGAVCTVVAPRDGTDLQTLLDGADHRLRPAAPYRNSATA
jgi:GGDEF domain-containing protein